MHLSIDSLTLMDCKPMDLIRSAHAARFGLVSLWTSPPALYPKQLLTPDHARECSVLLGDTGLEVHSIEMVDLVSVEAARASEPALELGARLGGKAVAAVHYANPDRVEAAEALGALVEVAAQFGLGVNIEPIAMGSTSTLIAASDLIRAAGVDAGIIFDTYHFVRACGHPADIAAIKPLIRYVQINDGPLQMAESEWNQESIEKRFYPGEGEFPLAELLPLLPRNIPWAIEAPDSGRANAGASSALQAAEAFSALQQFLTRLDETPTEKPDQRKQDRTAT